MNTAEIRRWPMWNGWTPALSRAVRDRIRGLDLEIRALGQLAQAYLRLPKLPGSFQVWGGLSEGARHRMLEEPAVSAWCASLRRTVQSAARGGDVADSLRELLAEFARIVSSAALLAGIAVELELSLRRGVTLQPPGFGVCFAFEWEGPLAELQVRLSVSEAKQLTVQHPCGTAILAPDRGEVVASSGALRVRAMSLPKITTPGLPITVEFTEPWLVRYQDASYPRDLTASIASRDDEAKWVQTLAAAVQLIQRADPRLSEELNAIVRCIVPLSAIPGYHVSSTRRDCIGAVWCSLADTCAVSEALVHEYGHTKLHLLCQQVALLAPDAPRGAVFHSPWRPDLRPLEGLLHGAFVAVFVARFWISVSAARTTAADARRAARAAARAVVATRYLGGLGHFSVEGAELVDSLAQEAERLAATVTLRRDLHLELERFEDERRSQERQREAPGEMLGATSS